jgi:DNA processing protein
MPDPPTPTPRQLLIALHADRRLPPVERRQLAQQVVHQSSWRRRPRRSRWPRRLQAWISAGAATAAAAEAAAADLGAHIVTLVDPDYPALLAATALPPPALVVRGRLPQGPAVAIVGSRLADAYGCDVAGRFARYLAAAGVVVVSGLARGIDTAAHEGALAAPSGRTVAVLGCGLGAAQGRGEAALADAIASRGALVSEFPCADGPRPWRFPRRNRTLAGLAAATLVVQATPRSGSLLTARCAIALGRPVFAVPGPVFSPLSAGPHALLRGGAARLASHPHDLLAVVSVTAVPPAAPGGPAAMTAADRRSLARDGEQSSTGDAPEDAAVPAVDPPPLLPAAADAGLADVARAVLAELRPRAGRSPEEVARRAGLTAEQALVALLELEIAGTVERLHGTLYRRVKPSRSRPPPARPPPSASATRRRQDRGPRQAPRPRPQPSRPPPALSRRGRPRHRSEGVPPVVATLLAAAAEPVVLSALRSGSAHQDAK